MPRKQLFTVALFALIIGNALHSGVKRPRASSEDQRAFKKARRSLTQEQQRQLNEQLRGGIKRCAAEHDKEQARVYMNHARALMRYGADINANFPENTGDGNCGTMLHQAITDLSTNEVQVLIDLGADVNKCVPVKVNGFVCEEKFSPLHLFAKVANGDNVEQIHTIMNLLIGAKADVNICNCEGDSVLHSITYNPQFEGDLESESLDIIFRSVVTSENINSQNSADRTPLMDAMCCEKSPYSYYAKQLIDYGCNVSITDDKGNNFLHHLASSFYCFPGLSDYDVERVPDDLTMLRIVAKKALQRCPDLLEQRNCMGETPLFVALSRGGASLNIFKLFLQQVRSKDEQKRLQTIQTIFGENCGNLLGVIRKKLSNRSNKDELWQEIMTELRERKVLLPSCKLAKILKHVTPKWCAERRAKAAEFRTDIKEWLVGKQGDLEPSNRHYLPAVLAEIILEQAGHLEPKLYQQDEHTRFW